MIFRACCIGMPPRLNWGHCSSCADSASARPKPKALVVAVDRSSEGGVPGAQPGPAARPRPRHCHLLRPRPRSPGVAIYIGHRHLPWIIYTVYRDFFWSWTHLPPLFIFVSVKKFMLMSFTIFSILPFLLPFCRGPEGFLCIF